VPTPGVAAAVVVYRGSHEAIEGLVDGLPAILPEGWSHFRPEFGDLAAPTIVISAYPTAIGSCSQALDLGYRRTGAFTITVGV
jgi:hypothetical protein